MLHTCGKPGPSMPLLRQSRTLPFFLSFSWARQEVICSTKKCLGGYIEQLPEPGSVQVMAAEFEGKVGDGDGPHLAC